MLLTTFQNTNPLQILDFSNFTKTLRDIRNEFKTSLRNTWPNENAPSPQTSTPAKNESNLQSPSLKFQKSKQKKPTF